CFISSSLCHHTYLFIFFTLLPPPPTSTLFPYTTLFRSRHELHLRPLVVDVGDVRFVEHGLQQVRRNEVDAFPVAEDDIAGHHRRDRKSTRLNSSHVAISYAVFCLKKKNKAAGVQPGSH